MEPEGAAIAAFPYGCRLIGEPGIDEGVASLVELNAYHLRNMGVQIELPHHHIQVFDDERADAERADAVR
jgi:hypothetical protein